MMTAPERPTILLVEDDRATRELFDYVLRMAGYRVITAADGFVALRLLEQEAPDLIVLDLDLPQVSGLDVQQEVLAHRNTSAIPIIVVTGTDLEPRGVFQTLRKPVRPDVLLTVVARAFGGAEGPPQGALSRHKQSIERQTEPDVYTAHLYAVGERLAEDAKQGPCEAWW